MPATESVAAYGPLAGCAVVPQEFGPPKDGKRWAAFGRFGGIDEGRVLVRMAGVMPEYLQVFREGMGLGAWERDEARELLRQGFLQETDRVRHPESGLEQELGEYLRTTSPPRSAGGATETVWDRSFKVAGSALGRMAGRMMPHWRELMEPKGGLSAGTRRLLEGALPWIRSQAERLMESGAMREWRGKLGSEEVQRRLFGAVHDLLPRPLMRWVPRQEFIEFCWRHRERLLGRPSETRPDPASMENPS